MTTTTRKTARVALSEVDPIIAREVRAKFKDVSFLVVEEVDFKPAGPAIGTEIITKHDINGEEVTVHAACFYCNGEIFVRYITFNPAFVLKWCRVLGAA